MYLVINTWYPSDSSDHINPTTMVEGYRPRNEATKTDEAKLTMLPGVKLNEKALEMRRPVE